MTRIICVHARRAYPWAEPESGVAVQLRLRVDWQHLDDYLGLYNSKLLPVDQQVRKVQRFFHETRRHYNLTFVYHYRDWEHMTSFEDEFIAAWMEVHGIASLEEARDDILATEDQLGAWIRDDERLILASFPESNPWREGQGEDPSSY